MIIHERDVTRIAGLLGCSCTEVRMAARAYDSLDLDSLSWTIKGEAYKPLSPDKPKCERCHLPIYKCFCSEFDIRQKKKSANN